MFASRKYALASTITLHEKYVLLLQENTLLDNSKRPLVKMCDFGYSKHAKDSLPKSKVGTPGYTGQTVCYASICINALYIDFGGIANVSQSIVTKSWAYLALQLQKSFPTRSIMMVSWLMYGPAVSCCTSCCLGSTPLSDLKTRKKQTGT